MEISWDGIEKVEFKKDDILIREGETGFYFYIIHEGEIEVYRTSSKGVDKRLEILGAGQAVGEFALVTQKPRSASARAMSDGLAYKVSEENYEKLLNDLPGWAVAILHGLIERLKKTNEALAESSI